MKRINITLDEETAKVLANKVNMSKTIRDSVLMYHGAVSTDTLEGMRAAFLQLLSRMTELEERFVEQYELVEKLTNMLEERMQ